jgi:hypothetical protein
MDLFQKKILFPIIIKEVFRNKKVIKIPIILLLIKKMIKMIKLSELLPSVPIKLI